MTDSQVTGIGDDAELLDQMALEWEEARDAGKPLSIDDLCKGKPQLRDALGKRVDRLQQMEALFDTSIVNEASVMTDFSLGKDLLNPETSELPTIPGYELLECVGWGGMGVVYKAMQQGLNRLVAIKLMRFSHSENAGVCKSESDDEQRFLREAESIASLNHSNIVAVHDVGRCDAGPFFSMEFLPGKSLADRIHDSPIGGQRAAAILKHIAEAVSAAHAKGLLHRDLKPANILFDHNDQPVVTDFGLAKNTSRESLNTVTGQVLGTPSFMPPEQAGARHDEIDQRSDVYGLGGILYAMLTGHPPFRSDSAVATLMQVVNEPPIAPRRLNPTIDLDLDTICLKCLEKRASSRYESAAGVAADLQRYLLAQPISARPIGRFAKLWRYAKRNRAIATLSLVSVLSLVLATGISAYFAVRANQNLAVANDKTREANANLAEMKKQKLRAEQNEAIAVSAQEEAYESAELLKMQAQQLKKQTFTLAQQTENLTKQRGLLEKSITEYLQMYVRVCSIGGRVATAKNPAAAKIAFAAFDSSEQLVSTKSIRSSQAKLESVIQKWQDAPAAKPPELGDAAISLASACRQAWERRCNATFSGRSGSVSRTALSIQSLERELIIKTIFDRILNTAKALAVAKEPKLLAYRRVEFNALYWGSVRFVLDPRGGDADVLASLNAIFEKAKASEDEGTRLRIDQDIQNLQAAIDRSLQSPASPTR